MKGGIMVSKKVLVAASLLLVMLVASCTHESATQKRQAALTEAYSARLEGAVPYPLNAMNDSLERRNVRERLLRFNDASKIGYIYLLGFTGNVVAYYTIKGKVSSVNSQLTITNQVTSCGDGGGCVVDSMGDDGSFGPNEGGDAGIFFFTTEGTMVEWAGQFLYSDEPLTLSEAPVLSSKG